MSAKVSTNKTHQKKEETEELLDSEQDESAREAVRTKKDDAYKERKSEAAHQKARWIENTGPHRDRKENSRSRQEPEENSQPQESRPRKEETTDAPPPRSRRQIEEDVNERKQSEKEPLLHKEKKSTEQSSNKKGTKREVSEEPRKDKKDEKHSHSPKTDNKGEIKDVRHKRQVETTPKDVEVVPPERPPLAHAESDEEDDREVVSKPYPGVDDGFFDPKDSKPVGKEPEEKDTNPETEEEPHDVPPSTRGGPDGGSENPDDVDGIKSNEHPANFPNFPDVELGGIPDLDSIPDVNVYQHKKTLAQGMMDLALFSANANQLRYVLESYNRHPYFYPSAILIGFSLILQVAVGIGLIWNATYNVKDDKEICHANRISNFTIIGIFLITVVNVFISAFGVGDTS